MRGFNIVIPAHRAGIAALATSDHATGYLTQSLAELFVSYLSDGAKAEKLADALVTSYAGRAARVTETYETQEKKRNDEARWQGWQWAPLASRLADYKGTFAASGELNPIIVTMADGGLLARHGAMKFKLRPASPDLFGGKTAPYDGADSFQFVRDGQGGVGGVIWGGIRFDRRPGKRAE
jgi:hypothetical protein